MIRLVLAGCLAVGAGALLLRARFVAVTVEGDSMSPTLRPGDRVLVRKVSPDRVRRAQIVVLAPPPDLPAPEDNPPWLIKRVVAVPGDEVPIGIPALRDQLGSRVPAGRFVVLGDNSARSYDSRRVGYFPADALLGVVVRALPGAR